MVSQPLQPLVKDAAHLGGALHQAMSPEISKRRRSRGTKRSMVGERLPMEEAAGALGHHVHQPPVASRRMIVTRAQWRGRSLITQELPTPDLWRLALAISPQNLRPRPPISDD